MTDHFFGTITVAEAMSLGLVDDVIATERPVLCSPIFDDLFRERPDVMIIVNIGTRGFAHLAQGVGFHERTLSPEDFGNDTILGVVDFTGPPTSHKFTPREQHGGPPVSMAQLRKENRSRQIAERHRVANIRARTSVRIG